VRGREKKEGHGLGLAIVHETLERDGGELSLRNVDTGGLRVEIKLPKA
jgi:signal transduction histidine kinase